MFVLEEDAEEGLARNHQRWPPLKTKQSNHKTNKKGRKKRKGKTKTTVPY